MISPDEVRESSEKNEKENLEFRTYLKINANEKELDQQFYELHTELFEAYDCSKCRNCCKAYKGSILWADVRRDARHLHMPYRQFMEKYLEEEDDNGIYETKHIPCDFLNENNECILGECKPENCKKFPYTNQPERLQSLYSLIEAVSVCPVAYEIYERLKKMYGFKA